RPFLDGRDARAADHETGGDRDGGLESQSCAVSRTASAEERPERARHRHERERLERTALRALTARERRALSALAHVRPQLAALRPRQPAVELSGDGELRLPARQGALELLAQRPARPEDQSLDRARRDV